jgi:isochorismate synthase
VRPTTALAAAARSPIAAESVEAPAGADAIALLRAFPRARRFLWEQAGAGVAIAAIGETLAVRAAGPERFRTLAAALDEAAPGELPPGVVAVGGFAFDDAAAAGPWRGFPSAELVIPRLALVRRDGRAHLVATALRADADLGALLGRARAALARPAAAPPPPTGYRAARAGSVARWRRAVEATLEDIAAGRLAKLVLARAVRVRATARLDPLGIAARLRRAYPGCTVFAVARAGATFVGASPERLVRLAGGALETVALAGTAARGGTPAADRALARALLASAKERLEHDLVVDDVRARLAPLCSAVSAPERPGILTTETVQHLRTPVTARLRPGRGLLDVVAALHPTPAICGAPRAAALAALRPREGLARGWYGGGVGWLDAQGGEVALAIRTALVRGRDALLHAGAGIVAGSTWEAELEETRLKMRPLLAALLEL